MGVGIPTGALPVPFFFFFIIRLTTFPFIFTQHNYSTRLVGVWAGAFGFSGVLNLFN